jgi:UDP-N-acetylmuramate dehydrogenase
MASIAQLRDVQLAPLTTWRVGGTARLALVPSTLADLTELSGACEEHRFAVMGGGTNLLVDDGEIDVPVILTARAGRRPIEVHPGDTMIVDGSWPMPRVARFAERAGIAGLAFLAGIPGTVGGGIRMNAGTGGLHGPAIADVVKWVEVLDSSGTATYERHELGFDYRTSRLAAHPALVLRVALRAIPGDRREIRAQLAEVLLSRRSRQPLTARTAGSVFLPVGDVPAGAIIEESGLRGAVLGRARVSPKHANWIEALDNCTATEITALIDHVQHTVAERRGCELKREVQYFPEEAVKLDLYEPDPRAHHDR